MSPAPQSDHQPAGKTRGSDLLEILDAAHQFAADGQGVAQREVATIPVDRIARRQFSFSRLTGRLVRSDVSQPPSLHNDQERAGASSTPVVVNARGLGSLVHEVLARIDFNAADDIRDWCEHLAPSFVVENADEAARLACEMIERFVASPRGRELAQAAAMHREIEFLLAWPPGAPNTGGRYLQGYIDCLFQDATGAWHLADYKTNNVTAANIEHEAQRYEMQLYVYAMAAERALGDSPEKLVLHFLRPGVDHVFPWNDVARKRAIELVDEALSQYLTSDTLNPES
jgi:ATP-dependent exoDNAse (exonuclease V) beta subunit